MPRQVRLRDSKFGMALVLETSEVSGGYVLGFRLDPLEKMKDVQKEISALFRAFSQNPVFGVTYSPKSKVWLMIIYSLSHPDPDFLLRLFQTFFDIQN